jgi:putative transcriptional regulator
MIKCNLSRILGEKKLKVSDVERDTNINKNTLHRLSNGVASRVDLSTLDILCQYLDITLNELFDVIKDT